MASSDPSPSKDHSAGFGDQAALYAAFRPSYPDMIFDRLMAHLRSAPERAVDLGAGSGQATRELARRFAQVTAVEPDPRMVDFFPAPGNVCVQNMAAEDADFPAQSIDAVISATAFHWMDQARVCAAVARWLKPGGIFFPFLYGPFRMEGAAAGTFRKHSALWGPYKDARLGSNVDYGKSIRMSGAFDVVEFVGMEMRFKLSPQSAAGFVLTMSYAIAYARANGGLDAYENRLVTDFSAVEGDIIAAAHLGGVIARRKSD